MGADLGGRGVVRLAVIALSFLNMGGVPPLFGFWVKMSVLPSLCILSGLLGGVLVLLSVLILAVYVRIFIDLYAGLSLRETSLGGGRGRESCVNSDNIVKL